MKVKVKKKTIPGHKKKLLRIWPLFIVFVFGNTANIAFSAELSVIPDAAGWGITTPAGRGGAVYRVTNLNSSGPGSLRTALEKSGARVVVFEVSGNIKLAKVLNIYNPYITIAGQTAPSPGITVRGAGLFIHTHDVLVQHMRFRVGDDINGPDAENRDGISIDAGDSEVNNVVVDHCSVSWAVDGNVDLWATTLEKVTVQNCIISEALHASIHPKGRHSTGMLIGQGVDKITIFANLFAHNNDRVPLMNEFSNDTEVINNLVYNWRDHPIRTFAPTNIIANNCQPGPDTAWGKGIQVRYGDIDDDAPHSPNSVYIADNIGLGRPSNVGDDWDIVDGEEYYRTNTPYAQGSDLVPMRVEAVHDHVLGKAGARPLDRDAVDLRVVKSVRDGDGKIINSQEDVGGWPDLAENKRSLDLPENKNGDDDGDGYTNLEEWLHAFAEELEGEEVPDVSQQPRAPMNFRTTTVR